MRYYSETQMTNVFINSETGKELIGDSGFFLLEVPVGHNSYQKESGGAKRIDVVAVFIKSEEMPRVVDNIAASYFIRSSSSLERKTMAIKDMLMSNKKLSPEDVKHILNSLTKEPVWLIEAKRVLDSDVLGQILVNRSLFKEDYPHLRIEGMGIICIEANDRLRRIFKKYKIKQIWEPKKK